jgi:ABC transporter substrate binding protein
VGRRRFIAGSVAVFAAPGVAEAQSSPIFRERMQITQLALKNRRPTSLTFREYVDASGLRAYGASFVDMAGLAAVYLDKILKGAKPADLPIRAADYYKFELVINLQAAKAQAGVFLLFAIVVSGLYLLLGLRYWFRTPIVPGPRCRAYASSRRGFSSSWEGERRRRNRRCGPTTWWSGPAQGGRPLTMTVRRQEEERSAVEGLRESPTREHMQRHQVDGSCQICAARRTSRSQRPARRLRKDSCARRQQECLTTKGVAVADANVVRLKLGRIGLGSSTPKVVLDVGDPLTKGENRCQPKQSARSCTRLAEPGRTATGGPIS